MSRQIRGIESHQEIKARTEWRDIRSSGERFRLWLTEKQGFMVLIGMLVALMWMVPILAELLFVIGLCLAMWMRRQTQSFHLPFKLPAWSRLKDPNDPPPGRQTPGQAQGIGFLGNEVGTKKELWFNSSDLRTHILAFGSTGAGKTETLISMAYNCLLHGSGFIYIDGKGDNELWAKIFSICRSLGREDDLLLVNYMTGGRDLYGPQATKRSNTINPFTNGSAANLTEIIVSLMDGGGGKDGDMWKGRAISLISAVMTALAYQRDNAGMLLDIDAIRDHLILENIQKLAKQRDMPASILAPLRSYLRSLPGYQESSPGGQQSETVLEQHGYLQMQFTKILGSLADTYGFIFRTNLGEIDFVDVVVNRRILVVLLPAMEKSPDDLSNLGKIIVACLKQMMATGLGSEVEGTYRDIIETKPTKAPSPYMCILDEYGYYVVKGAAVMPAQARSLGFCMVFAGQDYPSFKKNDNAEEAAATIGNCNIKIFMKIEDPTDTFDLFKQSVGEASVSKTSGFTREQGGLVARYSDQNNASIERRNRGDWLDLKDQREGEAHILFKSTLIRANMFYAAPQLKNGMEFRTNQFLRTKAPSEEEMQEYEQSVEAFEERLSSQTHMDEQVRARPEAMAARARHMIDRLEREVKAGMSLRDSLLASLSAAADLAQTNLDQLGALSQQLGLDMAAVQQQTRMDAFGAQSPYGALSESDLLAGLEGDDDEDEDEDEGEDYDSDTDDSSPDAIFLNSDRTREHLEALEQHMQTPDRAQAQAKQVEDSIRAVSSYPKQEPPPLAADEILGIIEDITPEGDGNDDNPLAQLELDED